MRLNSRKSYHHPHINAPKSPTRCSTHPVGRRAGSPGGVRDAECSPICRVHSGLVPFSAIYLSIYLLGCEVVRLHHLIQTQCNSRVGLLTTEAQ